MPMRERSPLCPAAARIRRMGTLGLLLGLICLSAPAGAQQRPPPSRNANIFNGLDHQPTPSEVEGRERQQGVAPDSSQQAAENATIEHLYRELEQQPKARTD